MFRKQENHEFYDQYRDHVVHTLQVYLLGLDLLHGLPGLSRKIEGPTDSLSDLYRKWSVAALGHDQGYALEVQEQTRVPDELQALLANPLADFTEIDSGFLRRHITRQHAPCEFVEQLTTCSVAPSLKDDGQPVHLLEMLDARLPPNLIGPTESPLQNYFDFSRKYHHSVWDHGICGVLIVLQMHYRLIALLQSVDWQTQSSAAERRTRDFEIVSRLSSEMPEATDDVIEACLAIALHNIYASIPDDQQELASTAYNLRLSEYRLSLQQTALAWFLAFCDCLQCWNRPRSKFGDDAATPFVDPQNVSLDFDGEYAYLSFDDEQDHLAATSRSRYETARLALTAYLDEGDVSSILRRGPISTKGTRASFNGASLADFWSLPTVTSRQNSNLLGDIKSTMSPESIEWQITHQHRLYPHQPPVCVLYTGGSVGMVPSDPRDDQSPLITRKLSRVIPWLRNLYRLRFDIDFYETPKPLDSSNIDPDNWFLDVFSGTLRRGC